MGLIKFDGLGHLEDEALDSFDIHAIFVGEHEAERVQMVSGVGVHVKLKAVRTIVDFLLGDEAFGVDCLDFRVPNNGRLHAGDTLVVTAVVATPPPQRPVLVIESVLLVDFIYLMVAVQGAVDNAVAQAQVIFGGRFTLHDHKRPCLSHEQR